MSRNGNRIIFILKLFFIKIYIYFCCKSVTNIYHSFADISEYYWRPHWSQFITWLVMYWNVMRVSHCLPLSALIHSCSDDCHSIVSLSARLSVVPNQSQSLRMRSILLSNNYCKCFDWFVERNVSDVWLLKSLASEALKALEASETFKLLNSPLIPVQTPGSVSLSRVWQCCVWTEEDIRQSSQLMPTER